MTRSDRKQKPPLLDSVRRAVQKQYVLTVELPVVVTLLRQEDGGIVWEALMSARRIATSKTAAASESEAVEAAEKGVTAFAVDSCATCKSHYSGEWEP